jgi:hypothetical protein
MLLPLAVTGKVVTSTNEKCTEDQGHDSSILLQKEVGMRSALEQGNHGRAVHGVGHHAMSQDDIRSKLAAKQGMNANAEVGIETLDLFNDLSSWFWTYSLAPNPKALAWGKANGKEFVPLVNLKRVLPKNRKYGKCSFQDGSCTVDMLVEVLEDTKNAITTRYLMGYNEPYASHQEASAHGLKSLKGVNGTEGARWWRLWVQPAAERTNLTLVSPTTGISSQKSDWMIEFLQACYDNKDADPPCNVEKIKVYSVHEYKCYASFWRKYAALDGGDDVHVRQRKCEAEEGPFKPRKEVNFYVRLKKAMRERYGDVLADNFWDPYFNSVKLWVTETSCSGDLNWNKVTKGKADKPSTPTAEQSCQYITGQSCQHQEGSVAALLGLDNVERFSWFTLFPDPSKDHPNYESIVAAAMMDTNTKEPRPPGRALLSALDPSAAAC